MPQQIARGEKSARFIRIPAELDAWLVAYSKQHDVSINLAVTEALLSLQARDKGISDATTGEGETKMSTGYKLLNHAVSGETYAIAWADENDGSGEYILGIAGPLQSAEAAALVGKEGDCDFDTDVEEMAWAADQTWAPYPEGTLGPKPEITAASKMTVEHLGADATEEDLAEFRRCVELVQTLVLGRTEEEATDLVWNNGRWTDMVACGII